VIMSKVYQQFNSVTGVAGVAFGGGGGGGGRRRRGRVGYSGQKPTGGLTTRGKVVACSAGVGIATGLSYAPHPAAKAAGGGIGIVTAYACKGFL